MRYESRKAANNHSGGWQGELFKELVTRGFESSIFLKGDLKNQSTLHAVKATIVHNKTNITCLCIYSVMV